MLKFKFLVALPLLSCVQTHPASLKSIAHAALFHTLVKTRPFNHTPIAQDSRKRSASSSVHIAQDASGAITHFYDGHKTPLVLGSIPRSAKDLKALKKQYHLSSSAGIDVLSMNRHYELRWSGLWKTMKHSVYDTLFRYPTTDCTPPTLIDLMRVVRDIKERDLRGQALTYVHCRAGKGRSATAVIAYLLVTAHEAGYQNIGWKDIEKYIKARRTIYLASGQRKLLDRFEKALQKSGSFNTLCAPFKHFMKLRDAQVHLPK